MAESHAEPVPMPPRRGLQALLKKPALEWLIQNPVVLKELRGRMRGGRAFILITVYLLLLSAIVGLVYFGFILSSNSAGSGWNATDRQAMGKAVFAIVVTLELLMVSFVAPALTAAAISNEREHQTFDLLRTTLLPANLLVLGKLASALSFLLLLLVTAFPIQSLASLLGGVAFEEILIAFLILVVTAVAYSALGLFFSSFVRRTLAATVLAYATAIFVVFGIPIMILTSIMMMDSLFNNLTNNMNTVTETGLLLVGWFLISINPLATAIASEIILINNQDLFITTIQMPSGSINFPVISPWISYCILYLLFSVLLVLLSIHFVRQVER